MGIRQTLNENPVVTAAATGAIILIALIFIVMQAFGGRSGSGYRPTGKSFYSDDDGKTWFVDDANKIPPIDHDGKTAYRAVVYKCADGTKFVGHLERFSAEAKAQMEEQIKTNPKSAPVLQYTASMAALEVKKPGEGDWIKMIGSPPNDVRAIMEPRCPADGSTTGVEPVRAE